MDTIFAEIGVVIIFATFFALIVRLFKQPPLIGYILTGVILGPIGMQMMHTVDVFEAFKQIGVAFLLFLVGMELDWNKAKHLLPTTFALGIGQIVGSFLLGLLFSLSLGLDPRTGLYLGTILAFSSTVIVVKVLSEARDLNTLHGRISVGILLLQDFIAVTALVVISGLIEPSTLPLPQLVGLLLLKVGAFLVLLRIISAYILPPLFARIARSSELLFLSSVSWCFVVSLVASYYEFPLELGAFLAGISLASLPYTLDVLTKLRSLRDFFVILFFVGLGTELHLPTTATLPLTLGLLVITVLLKPLLSFIILLERRYKNRTAFLTALTQGQISEFSLILVALALENGHLLPEIASSIIFAAVVSLFLSTIFLTHKEGLYTTLRPLLQIFEPKNAKEKPLQDFNSSVASNHVVIFGYHRMGYHILKKLHSLNKQVLIVDFNPDIVKRLKSQGIPCIYGDVQDDDILEQTNTEKAAMVISTIPHREETLYLITTLKKLEHSPLIIVTSHNIDDALEYYRLGASYVILPHLLGGEHVAELITQYQRNSLVKIMHHRAEEIRLLKTKNHALYYD